MFTSHALIVPRLASYCTGLEVSPLKVLALNAVATAVKAFDMDMRFGPRLGISRAARWLRADHHGLKPPLHVGTIVASAALKIHDLGAPGEWPLVQLSAVSHA